MTTPRWLDWDLFYNSACDDFIVQIDRGKGIASGVWRGAYLGDQNFGSSAIADDEDYVFYADGSCKVKSIDRYFLHVVSKWAKKFLLFYDGDKLIFNVDNGDGTKRIDLSIAIDWEQWCGVWNDGGVCLGSYDDSPLTYKMFDDSTTLSWDGKKITVKFNEEGQSDRVYTPAEFVRRAVDATANRFEHEFHWNWLWLFCKSNGWMKRITSWEEFNNFLKQPHSIQYQTDRLQKGGDRDFYQTEMKVEFADGSALYGVADGVEGNYAFVKHLSFKGDFDDDSYKFTLPVPLLMSDLDLGY